MIAATQVFDGVPNRTYGEDRICAAPGCGTRLSKYNPGRMCAAHECGVTDPAGEKTCNDCGQTKPLDEFVHDVRRPDGRKAQCKVCTAAKARARYQNDPLKRHQYLKRKREWAKAKRATVVFPNHTQEMELS